MRVNAISIEKKRERSRGRWMGGDGLRLLDHRFYCPNWNSFGRDRGQN